MKKEKFQKKLNINKKTVTNLSEENLGALRGGISGGNDSCYCPKTRYPVTNCGDSQVTPCNC